MTPEQFKERVYELAFGDSASERMFTDEEVLSRLTVMVAEFPKFEEKLQELSRDGDEQSEEDYEFYERANAMVAEFREGYE